MTPPERETPPLVKGGAPEIAGGDKDSVTDAASLDLDPTLRARKLPAPGTEPDWAAALTCPYACGMRHCPWECPAVFGGAA
jgi:hypothetical protein